jgi:hypothetical protein
MEIFKNLFKEKEVTYVITYIGGFIEGDDPIHRWPASKVVKAKKSKDINEIIKEVQLDVCKGAYGYFEFKGISILNHGKI